jgi:hypothetical protein
VFDHSKQKLLLSVQSQGTDEAPLRMRKVGSLVKGWIFGTRSADQMKERMNE